MLDEKRESLNGLKDITLKLEIHAGLGHDCLLDLFVFLEGKLLNCDGRKRQHRMRAWRGGVEPFNRGV